MNRSAAHSSDPRLARRAFLRYAGASSAAAVLLLAGCKKDDDDPPPAPGNPNGEAISLGSGETALVNLLQVNKQVLAELYKRVLDTPPAGLTLAEQELLRAVASHQAIHRDFLKAAVNMSRTKASDPDLSLSVALTFDFGAVGFGQRDAVLTTALTLMNLAVSAGIGMTRYLTKQELLTTIGKISSVDARQAATVAALVPANSPLELQDTAPDARNRSRLPSEIAAVLNTYLASGSRLITGNLP